MEEVASVVKSFSCDSCSKYVCNAMSVNSKCSDCCEISIVTEEIEISDDISEISIEISDCCHYHDN